jgi:plasmid stability protein
MTEMHVIIPDDVAKQLAAEAVERGTSAEDVAAEVLCQHVPGASRLRPRFVGKGHSGRHDLSEQVEEILSAELGS